MTIRKKITITKNNNKKTIIKTIDQILYQNGIYCFFLLFYFIWIFYVRSKMQQWMNNKTLPNQTNKRKNNKNDNNKNNNKSNKNENKNYYNNKNNNKSNKNNNIKTITITKTTTATIITIAKTTTTSERMNIRIFKNSDPKMHTGERGGGGLAPKNCHLKMQ